MNNYLTPEVFLAPTLQYSLMWHALILDNEITKVFG